MKFDAYRDEQLMSGGVLNYYVCYLGFYASKVKQVSVFLMDGSGVECVTKAAQLKHELSDGITSVEHPFLSCPLLEFFSKYAVMESDAA